MNDIEPMLHARLAQTAPALWSTGILRSVLTGASEAGGRIMDEIGMSLC